MPEKYDLSPTQHEANWLLVSMHNIDGINAYLNTFPTQMKDISKKGCSATLLWSGSNGNNVPVTLFEDQKIGFVLHSELVDVPQADLVAYRSGGMVQTELLKGNSFYSSDYESTKYTSKYPNKAGYYRTGNGNSRFVTNLARNEHEVDKKTSIYHAEGSAALFAKNIWRKFHKSPHRYLDESGIMRLNEAIVFQKERNPIVGLFINEAPDVATASQLLTFMKGNRSLNLYFYDKSSPEHIVRYMNNAQALTLLEQPMDFKLEFDRAQPFNGFSPPLSEASASSLRENLTDLGSLESNDAVNFSPKARPKVLAAALTGSIFLCLGIIAGAVLVATGIFAPFGVGLWGGVALAATLGGGAALLTGSIALALTTIGALFSNRKSRSIPICERDDLPRNSYGSLLNRTMGSPSANLKSASSLSLDASSEQKEDSDCLDDSKTDYCSRPILSILKQAEAGSPVPGLCREHDLSSATFYKW